MWIIANQDKIQELNEAMNTQWQYLAHLRHHLSVNTLAREALDEIWANQEIIEEALNEAILWERV